MKINNFTVFVVVLQIELLTLCFNVFTLIANLYLEILKQTKKRHQKWVYKKMTRKFAAVKKI